MFLTWELNPGWSILWKALMDEPLISVVIPSYNSAHFITDAIESVLAQTYRPLEIIVIDDGSTDSTTEVLVSYRDRISYFRQQNCGPAAARNTALREARGELVAFLDADDRWLPNKLALQWEFLRDHPDTGLVHTDVTYLYEETGEMLRKAVGRPRFAGNCYGELFFENRVVLSTVLVRRECLDKAGLFYDDLARAQDWDLWIRISRYDLFGYIDERLVVYRVHGSNISKNQLLMRQCELKVLERALAFDPDLIKKVGKTVVQRKLYDLCFDAGYLYYDRGDYVSARKYFAKALAHRWASPYLAALWSATWLPPSVVSALRRLKQASASTDLN